MTTGTHVKIIQRGIKTTALGLALALAACGKGSTVGDGNTGVEAMTAASDCDGACAGASAFLAVSDVQQIIAQAVNEAQARNARATVAVVDRVGNVLGVFRMTGAATTVTISSGGGVSGGLENVNIIPDTLAAISKAVTAAYLSTEGNAFSTRTASQIVQQNFNPGEADQASGPLFGVQFSQLPCSDVVGRFSATPPVGPKRAPLGLSADPGGFPLYKSGTPVGAVGVIADGVYGLDKNISDFDADLDELIALAGSYGYAAPPDRRADKITAGGRSLRFSDAVFGDLRAAPAGAPAFAALAGTLVAVTGYHAGAAVLAGSAFSLAASGIRKDSVNFAAVLDAFVLVDNADAPRYLPTAAADTPGGSAANALTADEVKTVLVRALTVANDARAQIRRPLRSAARVSIAVVDSGGAILGVVRSRDAPVFGIDVSVQKARSAAFFSRSGNAISPADALRALPDPLYLDGGLTLLAAPTPTFDNYVSALQTFSGSTNILEAAGSSLAISNRALGNLARPHYPDGPGGGVPGPLSKPAGQWSIFSDGVQLDLVHNAIIHHVGYVTGASVADVGINCTGSTGLPTFASSNPIAGLANGMQIFPGSVPVYRGAVLVGAIGVSGDGVDQDDMIAALGLQRAAAALTGSNLGHAAAGVRADTLTPQGVRLRYVSCPQTPFRNSDAQNACGDL